VSRHSAIRVQTVPNDVTIEPETGRGETGVTDGEGP
jgi:hypothetical protein